MLCGLGEGASILPVGSREVSTLQKRYQCIPKSKLRLSQLKGDHVECEEAQPVEAGGHEGLLGIGAHTREAWLVIGRRESWEGGRAVSGVGGGMWSQKGGWGQGGLKTRLIPKGKLKDTEYFKDIQTYFYKMCISFD